MKNEINLETLKKWHKAVEDRDISVLDDILAEDVVFHSPVVWTPQKGMDITKMYLFAAMHIIGGDDFKYIKEVYSDRLACLEFSTKIGDTIINGIDIISFDEAGLISEFKVMVRPIKGMMALKEKMFEMMQNMSG